MPSSRSPFHDNGIDNITEPPYVRKIRIVLHEKDIPCDFIVEGPWDPGSSVPKHNPLGKVPVLVLENDLPLYDSRVIVQFLELTSKQRPLLSSEPKARIDALRWEALADGMLDAIVLRYLEGRREPQFRDPAWIERQAGKQTAGLRAASEMLGERSFCVGEQFGLADIALAVALGYIDLRAPEPWRDRHNNLARLFDRMQERPSFTSTAPPT